MNPYGQYPGQYPPQQPQYGGFPPQQPQYGMPQPQYPQQPQYGGFPPQQPQYGGEEKNIYKFYFLNYNFFQIKSSSISSPTTISSTVPTPATSISSSTTCLWSSCSSLWISSSRPNWSGSTSNRCWSRPSPNPIKFYSRHKSSLFSKIPFTNSPKKKDFLFLDFNFPNFLIFQFNFLLAGAKYEFQFSGHGLDRKEIFSKSDPFLIFSRPRDPQCVPTTHKTQHGSSLQMQGDWLVVHKTEYVE